MFATPPLKRFRAPHEMSKRPAPSFKQVASAYAGVVASVLVVGALLVSCRTNEPPAQTSNNAVQPLNLTR